ncbi:dipeptidase [Sphingomonas turrisvirgatae]|uniref:Peptidase M19 n=1 Tax=Sphingomonas turrisvirgatae TaxID=1888892 RepID=A0A1E3LZ72_9SPHN|nr:dipeptidase [Sphingomonas turrisvirgatae]ODP39009.1 peptidase M19 [Sphingomonas turrisvirgatae]
MRKRVATLSLFALAACTATSQGGAPSAADPVAQHARLLTLDTHLDTPIHFDREGWRFDATHSFAADLSQVDGGRMKAGMLDGGFFVVYTEQGPLTEKGYADALAFARKRSDAIDRTVAAYPALIAPALTAADATRLNRAGKLAAFKSIENSYPLGEDVSLLGEFYRKGVRMAGPVHSGDNQFADSATGKGKWGGLSPLGKRWVAEMNRLGMVIDASHSSDATFDQLLELSRYPIILSHSSLRSANDHPRNLDQVRLRKLAAKGGAMCISTIFLSDMNMTKERAELFGAYERIATLPPAQQADLARRWQALDRREQMWNANFETVMAQILRAIEVAGIDHVCFAGDWDGGGGVVGMQDITALPKVTARLKAAGYSDADIEKFWSGNVLRILAAQKG